MSTRLDVLRAIATLIRTAVPDATVIGVDDDAVESSTVPAGGKVVIDAGDPGEPQVILGPVTYLWTHRVPLLVVADGIEGVSPEQAVDDLLTPIGAAIVADRTLGGRADWFDAVAPETSDLVFESGPSPRRADAVLLVTYATTNPLG